MTVTGAEGTALANATATVTVGEAPLPEIVRVEATGVIPLLDDNGQPVSSVYWDGETGTSQPIAAVPTTAAAAADVISARGEPSVSSDVVFETTKLKIKFRRPQGSDENTSETFTFQGRIPTLNPSPSPTEEVVVRTFEVRIPAGNDTVEREVSLLTTGQVRAEKLTLYGKVSRSSGDFTRAAYRILRDDPNAVGEPQKVYLPLLPPLKPFAGVAGDHVPDHVMQRACTYASGATTPRQVRARLTKGLFGWLCWKHGAEYSPVISSFGTAGVDVLTLSYFMKRDTDQDCQATSSFLEIHCSALGVEMKLQKVKPIRRDTLFPTRRGLGWGKAWGPQPAGADTNFPDFTPAATPSDQLFQPFSFSVHQFCVFQDEVHETSFGVLSQPGYLYNGNVTLADYYGRELPQSPGIIRLDGGLVDTVHIVQ